MSGFFGRAGHLLGPSAVAFGLLAGLPAQPQQQQPVPMWSATGTAPPQIVAGIAGAGAGGIGGYYLTRTAVQEAPEVWPTGIAQALVATRTRPADPELLGIRLPGDVPADRALVTTEAAEDSSTQQAVVVALLQLLQPSDATSLVDLLLGDYADMRRQIVAELQQLTGARQAYEQARIELQAERERMLDEQAKRIATELLQMQAQAQEQAVPVVPEQAVWPWVDLGQAPVELMTMPVAAPQQQMVVVPATSRRSLWPVVLGVGIAIGVLIALWVSASPSTAASPPRRRPPRPDPSSSDPTAPTSPRARRIQRRARRARRRTSTR
jgi:hypothetical protein